MRHLILVSLSSLVLGASACTTYQIRSAESHPTMPLVKLETLKTTNMFFWASVEHQFWMCQDAGDDLVCERSCGGGQDLECPMSTFGDNAMTSNTR